MENKFENNGTTNNHKIEQADLDDPPAVPKMPGIPQREQAGLDDAPAVPKMPGIPNIEKIYSEHPYLQRYIDFIKRAFDADPFKPENVRRSVAEANRVVFNDNFVGAHVELDSIRCKHGTISRFYFPESNSIRLGYVMEDK